MNSLLARLGHLESRRAVRTIWNSGKRKRGEWFCAECSSRKAPRPLRAYSDDAIRRPGVHRSEREEGSRGPLRTRLVEVGRDETTRTRATRGEALDELGGDDERAEQDRADVTFLDVCELESDPDGNQNAQEIPSEAQGQAALWEQFEQDPDVSGQSSQESDEVHFDYPFNTSVPKDSVLDLDYKIELPRAISGKAADVIIRCLFAAAQEDDMDFIGDIQASRFSEILRILDPSHHVVRLGKVHVDISSSMAESLYIAPMRDVAFEYSRTLAHVLQYRRRTGKLPSLEDYTLLLHGARLLGSHKFAEMLWANLLEDGHQPNTQCFNHYMASGVWNHEHNAGGRQKKRVTPFNMAARSGSGSYPSLRDRGAAIHRRARFGAYSVGDGGVKETTMKVFNEMLARGAVADRQSFEILITACARDGDMKTVSAILKRIWRIDVQGILEGKDENTITPASFPESSPLRPQSSLLYTLSHSFGINNDIPSALRVVDFVARHYDLEITMETWSELFEWTFVLAEPRDPDDPDSVGMLPAQSVMDLWQTMTGAPYFIKPTLSMYDRLLRNLTERPYPRSAQILEFMEQAWPQVRRDRRKSRFAHDYLCAAIDQKRSMGVIEQARKEWEYCSLIKERNRYWLRRWVRRLIRSLNRRHTITAQKHYHLLELPRVLWNWRKYAPRIVRYETVTGFVECELSTPDERRKRHDVRTTVVEEHELLKAQSRLMVGDDWAINYQLSEEAIREKTERRRLEKEVRAENNIRKAVETLAKEYRGDRSRAKSGPHSYT